MMHLTFSYNKSEKNKFAKTLVQLLALTGTLREGTSLIDPVIMVEGLDTTVTVSGTSYDVLKYVNYAYIQEFGRKYFITDIKTSANGLFIVSMHCDVLSTYHDEINAKSAIIRRQENAWNLYLDDGIFKTYANPTIITKAFPSGFTTQNFVLAVAGS